MDHWFDDLCKQFGTGGKVSRRSVLQGVLAGLTLPATGTLAKVTTGPAPVIQQPPYTPPPQPHYPHGCFNSSARGMSTQTSVSGGGATFRQQLSYDSTNKSSAISTTLTNGGTLLFKIDSTARTGGGGAATASFGPGFKGVANVSVSTSDGHTFQGTLDGRPFEVFGRPDSPNSVRFVDGKPAPKITLDPNYVAARSLLTQQVRASFVACREAPLSPRFYAPVHQQSRVDTPYQFASFSEGFEVALIARETGAGGSVGSGWYNAGNTYDAPDCNNCWNNCRQTAWDDSGLGSWETYVCVWCLVIAVALYNGIALVCWGTCQLPGGGCCPTPCGGAFTCCGRDANCFHNDLCCPKSLQICNNVCCGEGATSCAPDGWCGCPSGQAVCGAFCCSPGAVCCGTTCCPAGTTTCCGNDCGCKAGEVCCGGNTCCRADSCINNGQTCCEAETHYPCGGVCCDRFNKCCNNVCCGDYRDICLNGNCYRPPATPVPSSSPMPPPN